MAFANPPTSRRDVALSKLQNLHPAATWNKKSRAVADVTCDGQHDTVFLGSENGKVLIAIIPGKHPSKPDVLTFLIRRDRQDAFCAPPTRIITAPLNCETEAGTLPGCKVVKGCQEFSVDDGQCDPLNFYWDSTHQSLRWWCN